MYLWGWLWLWPGPCPGRLGKLLSEFLADKEAWKFPREFSTLPELRCVWIFRIVFLQGGTGARLRSDNFRGPPAIFWLRDRSNGGGETATRQCCQFHFFHFKVGPYAAVIFDADFPPSFSRQIFPFQSNPPPRVRRAQCGLIMHRWSCRPSSRGWSRTGVY